MIKTNNTSGFEFDLISIWIIVFVATLTIFKLSAQNPQIELKEGFFFINDEKFFIKGIGYEVGAIPGQLPWEREFNEELLVFDMNRIQSAGFNTIRTWAPFTEEELQVLSSYDIKIIMGIWIDPHGDFSDPEFISTAIDEVYSVLSYSKNSPNIIAYLIMNEPLPEIIFVAGYNNTVQLWTQLINIIHEEHPGIPVSIANTCNGTYINPEIFDFSAFNVYPYNPATVNFSHKYQAYVEYLKSLRSDDNPLIITEYGLSVSPSGPGNWGYGGNTLEEQFEGDLYMYRSLIDGGAAGSCMFNYSDGWWKGGDEFVHDDNPEEWFGLIEYQNLSDKYGVPRPVWNKVKTYQHAIITSPKNSEIYYVYVPLEIFGSDTTKSVEIYKQGELIYSSNFEENFLVGSIFMNVAEMNDITWDFIFYDEFYNVVKDEQKTFLCSNQSVEIPTITIITDPDPINDPVTVEITYSISEYQGFSHSDYIDYVFYPHIGWSFGYTFSETYQQSVTGYEFSDYHTIGDDTYVVTFAAGFDIHYGNFSKRIYNQLTIPIQNSFGVEDEYIFNNNNATIWLYPNPANDYFIIYSDDSPLAPIYYQIFDFSGKLIFSGKTEPSLRNKVEFLKPGIYFVEITKSDGQIIGILKLVKFS